MKFRILGAFGLLLAGGLFLTSCYFTSVNPLPPKAALHKELLGFWESIPQETQSGQKPGFLLFLEESDSILQVIIFEGRYQNSDTYRGFVSEIQGEKYLSLRQISVREDRPFVLKEEPYYLVHYRIKKNRIEITQIKESLIKQAIQEKRLQGSVAEKGGDISLTASTESLVEFIGGQTLKNLLEDEIMILAEKMRQLPKE